MQYNQLRHKTKMASQVRSYHMLRGCIIAIVVMMSLVNILSAQVLAPQKIDEGLAKQAYSLASNWVSRARVPKSTLPINVTNLSAVMVTLRFNGVTLATITKATSQPFQANHATDVTELIRQGVSDALIKAEKQFNLLQTRGGQKVGSMKELAPLLQLDIQFAQTPEKMEVANLVQLPGKFRIDEHGLVLKYNKQLAWVFPATAIASNYNLQSQLNLLLGHFDLSPTYLAKIGLPEGIPIYRFGVIHMVCPSATKPPMVLTRGQVVQPATPLNMIQINDLGLTWANYLMARQNAKGKFRGTYQPSADLYQPKSASISDAALCCYALARYSRAIGENTTDGKHMANTAKVGVLAICSDMRLGTDPTRVKQPMLMLADVSMTLIALIETPGSSTLKNQRDRLAGALLAMQKPDGTFRNSDNPQSREASVASASLATYAFARMYDQTRQEMYHNAARKAIDTILQKTPTNRQPATYPWLPLAEFELTRLGKASQALVVFRQGTMALLNKQIEAGDTSSVGIGPECIGGIIFQRNIISEPTWQTTRPLMTIAAAMRVKNLVNQKDRNSWLIDTSRGLRFLKQLTMDQYSCFYVRNIKAAQGGVRSAMWDNRQPLAATAMSLLVAAEFRHSINTMLEVPDKEK